MRKNAYFHLALKDIYFGFRQWGLAYLLGVGDTKQRYSRSKLGQFWITLSMLIFIIAIGVVYSFLFHQTLKVFLPYVACNYVIWSWMSASIIDSTTTFVQAQAYIKQTSIPRTVFVLRTLVRNFISMGHNFIIIPLVYLCTQHPVSWTIILALPGFLFILACSFFSCLSIGVICTRFRDIPQIVQAMLQVFMFVTPIMWPVTSLNESARVIVEYNPFAAILHMVTQPLQGIVPSLWEYSLASGTFLVLMVLGLYTFARFRARIVYWL